MRDFASSRGASEVKWLELNGEQKNQRVPLAWTAPEQASRPQACVEGASRPMRSRTGRRAAQARASGTHAPAWLERPAPCSAALQYEAEEAVGPRPAMDGSCSGQAPMVWRRAGMARRRAGEVRRWPG